MVDLSDVDCQVTLKLRDTLATHSRAAAVDFAVKNLVAGYSSRSFLREVAKLLRPLPPSGRGNKQMLTPELEFEMVQAYQRAVELGQKPSVARRAVMERFQPGIGDRQFRRKIAAWDKSEPWT